MTRHLLSTLIGMAVGAATVWAVYTFTLGPSEEDFRIRVAGHYAQQMSHYGVGMLASYKDCALEAPDPFDRVRGVSWVGECSTSARGTGYVYEVHLDSWARYRGDALRVLAP